MPVPIATAEPELEKSTSKASQRTQRTGRSDRAPATTAQDWDRDDDPDNPHNWSIPKKIYHTLTPALQSFTITFGSSVYSPSIPEVARDFHISETAAIIPLSIYVLGLGIGPVVSAPISETYGRRAVYILFFPASLLFTLGAGFSKSFGSLVACRLLAGLCGSGCLAVGAGTNADLFTHYHRAVSSAFFLMAPFFGPALGPAIGGYVAMKKGWRWTQWIILFWGVLAYAVTIFSKETYKRIILQRRAKKLGLQPPKNPLPPGMSKMHFILVVTLLRPLTMLATESIVAFFSIYTAFNFAVLFGFFAAFPVVFQSPYPQVQVYHFNVGESGLVFLGIGIGVVMATLIFSIMDRLTYKKKTLKKRAQGDFAPLPPEERLWPAMIGSFCLPISLFWFGWSARSDVHWISPILATIPFGVGNLLVFCSCVLYLLDTYGPLAGASAAAANGLLRYVVGAVFPLFTVQMYRALGVAWATSLLGFVTIALLPIPWVLYKFGPRIRQRSAYAQHAQPVAR
ncbi:MFS transporter [Exophiala viscosa]|uniref:MFS transporter n=2 Tax=Exophiala viscosa TaxID=2486360 RepID=A0AAN6DMP8_9EURO|nr:MFS transporter [Exophiala viscosa]